MWDKEEQEIKAEVQAGGDTLALVGADKNEFDEGEVERKEAAFKQKALSDEKQRMLQLQVRARKAQAAAEKEASDLQKDLEEKNAEEARVLERVMNERLQEVTQDPEKIAKMEKLKALKKKAKSEAEAAKLCQEYLSKEDDEYKQKKKQIEEDREKLKRDEERARKKNMKQQQNLANLEDNIKTISVELSEAEKLAGNAVATLQDLASGEIKFPKLFVLRRKKKWFGRFSSEYDLDFLCAYDGRPVGCQFQINIPTAEAKKYAPAIKTSLFLLKTVVAVQKIATGLGLNDLGLDSGVFDTLENAFDFNYSSFIKMDFDVDVDIGVDFNDDKIEETEDYGSDTGLSFEGEDVDALFETAEDISNAMTSNKGSSKRKKADRISGDSYRMMETLIEKSNEDWEIVLKNYMVKATDRQGKLAWVKKENESLWEKSKQETRDKKITKEVTVLMRDKLSSSSGAFACFAHSPTKPKKSKEKEKEKNTSSASKNERSIASADEVDDGDGVVMNPVVGNAER